MDEELNKDATLTQEEEDHLTNTEKEVSLVTPGNSQITCNKKSNKNITREYPLICTGKAMMQLKEVKEQEVRQKEIHRNQFKKTNLNLEGYSKFVDSELLFCPCGQKMNGSFTFFLHVKTQHSSSSLQDILKRQTLVNFIKKYPNNKRYQFEALESLENNNLQGQVSAIASKYQIKDFKCNRQLASPTLRGTYADLAFKFVEQFGQNEVEKILLIQFFTCIKDFIQRRSDETVWEQESPKDILKLANHMYYYFRAALRLMGTQYVSITSQHLKKLIYILGRWMFINKWTNDRLINLELQEDAQASVAIEKKQQPDFKFISNEENSETIQKEKKSPKNIMKTAK